MSGHSRWANIKHKKQRTDAKKGKVFTRLVKEITVAARLGGSDVSMNPRLRTSIEKARAENLPADTIDRAVKKGAGELESAVYEEGVYEGYGPGGVAMLVEFMTDNRNRTASEVRHAFASKGGRLAESGSVGWIFEKKGMFTFDMDDVDEDRLLEAAIDAGADDVVTNAPDRVFEVYTGPAEFHAVKAGFDAKGLKYTLAEITMAPKSTVHVEGKEARQVLGLIEDLEDLDDVQNVYANFDMPPEELDMAV